MGYIEINYKCEKCGKKDSQGIETWHLIEPMQCPECDQVMVEVSREDDLSEVEDDY